MGKNISLMRNKSNMTQEQLAEKADVSTVFISQIETAVRKPSLETIYKISTALNTTIDTLIGNQSMQAKYDEILSLISHKNETELAFIIGILREICNHTENGMIKK